MSVVLNIAFFCNKKNIITINKSKSRLRCSDKDFENKRETPIGLFKMIFPFLLNAIIETIRVKIYLD